MWDVGSFQHKIVKYYGQIMRKNENSLVNSIVTGQIEGNRSRERLLTRWIDTISTVTRLTRIQTIQQI